MKIEGPWLLTHEDLCLYLTGRSKKARVLKTVVESVASEEH